MITKVKAFGLTLLAVIVLGGLAAQTASAADEHEFHSVGEKTVSTGKGLGPLEFTVGAVGTVKCNKIEVEDTSVAKYVSSNTYSTDELTFNARWTECTFGGQPAFATPNDCAFILDSDTTEGNPTGGKHANITIECAPGNKIEIHTSNCTVTAGAQVLKHAMTFENDTSSSVTGVLTAHNVVVGKERTTAAQPLNGCLLFPTGAVGKLVGTSTAECRKDEDANAQANPTTPTGTEDATTTGCSVT